MEENTGVPGVGDDILAQAREMIGKEGTSCVVIREGKIIHSADGRGVSPLLMLYNMDREKLRGSCVVDRVIGKAAAMILDLGKVNSVYGGIMSHAAQGYLSERGIPFLYGQSVDLITDQTGEGICPIENSVLSINEPEAGLAAMTNRIAELQKASL